MTCGLVNISACWSAGSAGPPNVERTDRRLWIGNRPSPLSTLVRILHRPTPLSLPADALMDGRYNKRTE